MALHIAKRAVIAKIEALARATGLSKTAAVEEAVDRMLTEQQIARPGDPKPPQDWAWLDAIIGKVDDDFARAVEEQPEQQRRPALDEIFQSSQ
jgi:hypothetical protein